MTEAPVRRWLAYRQFLLRMRTGTVAQLWVKFLTGSLVVDRTTAAETSCSPPPPLISFIPAGTTGKLIMSDRNVYYQRSRFLTSDEEYIYFLDTEFSFLSESSTLICNCSHCGQHIGRFLTSEYVFVDIHCKRRTRTTLNCVLKYTGCEEVNSPRLAQVMDSWRACCLHCSKFPWHVERLLYSKGSPVPWC